jgi:hypothetical protein
MTNPTSPALAALQAARDQLDTLITDLTRREAGRNLLVAARNTLAQRGWVSGQLLDYAGRACATGALSLALDPSQSYGSTALKPIRYPRDVVSESDALDAAEAALVDAIPNAHFGSSYPRPDGKKAAASRTATAIIYGYNDAADQDQASILAWFDRAIESLS